MTKERIFSVTIQDCDVETKRGSGNGGQNRNKRDTAVRIVHQPSGAVGESQDQRSQLQNKKTAFRRMVETPKFHSWLRMQLGRGALIESQVQREMAPRNIITEVKKDGRWVKENSEVE